MSQIEPDNTTNNSNNDDSTSTVNSDNNNNNNDTNNINYTTHLTRDYVIGDIIQYDSDPDENDTSNIHKHKGTIMNINNTEITIKKHFDESIKSYNRSNIVIVQKYDDADNKNNTAQKNDTIINGLTATAAASAGINVQPQIINGFHPNLQHKSAAELAIHSEIDEKAQKAFDDMVKEIQNDDKFGKVEHDELDYRPFEYKSTVITRPNLKENIGKIGIKYTEWNESTHQWNYFRYWIGRYSEFRDHAKQIANDLKTVIEREEYDLDNVFEDMLLENDDNDDVDNNDDDEDNDDDDDESMILAEEEFEKYEWNNFTKNLFRLICCEVISILPFYKQWIELLKECTIKDMAPSIDTECQCLPCIPLKRLNIVSKFYNRWIKQNLGHHLQQKKNQFHFSVHDFMDGLEHYNSVEFQNDYQHLQHCHLEPISQKTKLHHGDAFGLNVGAVQNAMNAQDNSDDEESSSDEDSDDSSDDEDDDDDDKTENENVTEKQSKKKNKKKKKTKTTKNGPTLDSENRNVYEWFEDNLEDCDAETCPIFERTYRSRYDSNFEQHETEYYALNTKELNDWMQKVSEVQCQRIFDAMHTLIFHSSARYECCGLGNSEEHRKFVMLASQKRKSVKNITTNGHQLK